MFLPSEAYYYVIIVLNLLLRISWVLNLSTEVVNLSFGGKAYIYVMVLSYVEIMRRGIWNLLKVENEHIKNCQKFNAVVNYEYLERESIDLFLKNKSKKYVAVNENDLL